MLNDYNVTLHLRVKDNPRKWIVDCLFDTLNDKLGEDILYWDVKDIKDTNTKSSKSSKESNNNCKPLFYYFHVLLSVQS